MARTARGCCIHRTQVDHPSAVIYAYEEELASAAQTDLVWPVLPVSATAA